MAPFHSQRSLPTSMRSTPSAKTKFEILCQTLIFLLAVVTLPATSLQASPIGLSLTFGCVITTNGVSCWGTQPAGADTESVRSLLAPPTLPLPIALVGGEAHMCALRGDRTLACAFEKLTNNPFMYGNGDGVFVANHSIPFISISGGDNHICALDMNGAILCYGQLQLSAQNSIAALPPTCTGWSTLASKSLSTCAVPSGCASAAQLVTPTCWSTSPGSLNMLRQLVMKPFLPIGIDIANASTTTGSQTAMSVRPVTVVQFALGYTHACILFSDTQVVCQGSNEWGQVSGWGYKSTCVDIALGNDFSCCLQAISAQVTCVGYDIQGQLQTPVRQLSHVICSNLWCAATEITGTVVAWGINEANQVTKVPTTRFTNLTAGYDFTCGLRQPSPNSSTIEQRLICFGTNDAQQSYPPSEINDWVDVSGGHDLACGLRPDGTAVCWGSDTAAYPDTDLKYQSLYCGLSVTVGILLDGSLRVWGDSQFNQTSTPPQANSLKYSTCDTGAQHSCCVQAGDDGSSGGLTTCWGQNGYYQFIPENLTVSGVHCGGFHTIVWLPDGSAQCFGYNAYKQCDIPTAHTLIQVDGYRPEDVMVLADNSTVVWAEVHAGFHHSCGLLASSRLLVCWGYNSKGQVSPINKLVPMMALSLGERHSVGLAFSGDMYAWGDNTYGQSMVPGIPVRSASRFHYIGNDGIERPCPAGTFSIGQGATSPLCSGLCLDGSYSGSGASAFVFCDNQCPTGHACPPGSVEPTPCPPFQYQDTEGSGSCKPCQSSVHTNRTKCDENPDCPLGTMAGDDTCIDCLAGTWSNGSNSQCQRCAPGYYAPYDRMHFCFPCNGIAGLNCESGFAVIEKGYWAAPVADDGPLATQLCPIGYCEAEAGSFSANPCSPNRATNHGNLLCGRCQDGFREWNGACIECDKPNAVGIFVAIVFSLAYVLFLRMTADVETRHTSISMCIYFIQLLALQLGTKMLREWSAWLQMINFNPQRASSVCLLPMTPYQVVAWNAVLPFFFMLELLFILVVHYLLLLCQTYRPCCRRLDSKWAKALTSDKRTPMSRIGASQIEQEVASLRDPVLDYTLTPKIGRLKPIRVSRINPTLYWAAFVTLVVFSFQQVAEALFTYLVCTKVKTASGEHHVAFQAPGIVCNYSYDSDYFYWLVVICVLALTLPLTFFAVAAYSFYYRNESARIEFLDDIDRQRFKRLQHQQEQRIGMYSSLTSEQKSKYPYLPFKMEHLFLPTAANSAAMSLWYGYPPSKWLWPVWTLLRRGTMAAVAVGVYNASYRFFAFTLLNILSLILHVYFRPHIIEKPERKLATRYTSGIDSSAEHQQELQLVDSCCLLVLLIVSTFMLMESAEQSSGLEISLAVLVSVASLLMILYTALDVWLHTHATVRTVVRWLWKTSIGRSLRKWLASLKRPVWFVNWMRRSRHNQKVYWLRAFAKAWTSTSLLDARSAFTSVEQDERFRDESTFAKDYERLSAAWQSDVATLYRQVHVELAPLRQRHRQHGAIFWTAVRDDAAQCFFILANLAAKLSSSDELQGDTMESYDKWLEACEKKPQEITSHVEVGTQLVHTLANKVFEELKDAPSLDSQERLSYLLQLPSTTVPPSLSRNPTYLTSKDLALMRTKSSQLIDPAVSSPRFQSIDPNTIEAVIAARRSTGLDSRYSISQSRNDDHEMLEMNPLSTRVSVADASSSSNGPPALHRGTMLRALPEDREDTPSDLASPTMATAAPTNKTNVADVESTENTHAHAEEVATSAGTQADSEKILPDQTALSDEAH